MPILFLPWLLLLLLPAIAGCALKRWRKTAAGLLLVGISLNYYGSIIPIRFPVHWGSFASDSREGRFSVLAWNIHGGDKDTVRYEAIADRIIEADADVVFLSEVFTETAYVMDALLADRYPYRTTNFQWCAHYFYSKYPITDSAQIAVEGGNEVIVCSRFAMGGRELDIYGCHLTSNNCEASKIGYLNARNVGGGSSLRSYMRGIDYASRQRAREARRICHTIAARPCPHLVMGDMNDVCGSEALKIFAGSGLKDAWWQGGCGYGATIHRPLPYRIDHVMYDGGMKLRHISKIPADGLSDHDALRAVFEFE